MKGAEIGKALCEIRGKLTNEPEMANEPEITNPLISIAVKWLNPELLNDSEVYKLERRNNNEFPKFPVLRKDNEQRDCDGKNSIEFKRLIVVQIDFDELKILEGAKDDKRNDNEC
jgi:hypothetical protein